MSKLKTLIRKELKRFFTDKRMLAVLLMPGFMIFLLYSLIGSFTEKANTISSDYVFQIRVVHFPEQLSFINDDFPYTINIEELTQSHDTSKDLIEDKTIDLYVVFDENFYVDMLNYDVSSNLPSPQLEIYYNGAKNESLYIYQYYVRMLNDFEMQLANKFDINRNSETQYNLATAADFSRQFITGLVPFLLIIFLFTGSQAIATESIAGEKERGTIATLLATPTARSHIAIGKIIALSITALVSAASSFLGVMLSLPKLIGDNSFTLSMYGVETYFLLLIIIITTVLIMVALLSLISALSKSIKEAASMAAPLMLIIYIVGLTSMLGANQVNLLYYLIPLYNSVQSLTGIFNQTITIGQLVLTIVTNVTVFGIGVVLLTKAFDSEKAMFNK